jgi:hypothetical protein
MASCWFFHIASHEVLDLGGEGLERGEFFAFVVVDVVGALDTRQDVAERDLGVTRLDASAAQGCALLFECLPAAALPAAAAANLCTNSTGLGLTLVLSMSFSLGASGNSHRHREVSRSARAAALGARTSAR